MRARSIVSTLLLGLLSVGGLVHCSVVSDRAGFFVDKAKPSQDTDDSDPAGDDDDSTGFNTDGGKPPAADNSSCTQDIDVVLVLDVSSSMGYLLDKLGNEISGIVDAANKLKPGAHFGMIGFADNGAFATNGSDANGIIHTKAATLKSAFSDFKNTYTDYNRNPADGPNGLTDQNPLCEEDSLDSIYMAAHDYPWRPGAARVIIVTTDDTFLEAPDNYGDRDGDGKEDKTDYPREGNYPAVHTVKDTVQAVKDANARVFSITRLTAPGPFSIGGKCGTGRRHSSDDSVAYGWSQPYDNNQTPIPVQTDGKNFDLDQIATGKIDLAATINGVVLQTHCEGDPPK
jgi:hypothetical protein